MTSRNRATAQPRILIILIARIPGTINLSHNILCHIQSRYSGTIRVAYYAGTMGGANYRTD